MVCHSSPIAEAIYTAAEVQADLSWRHISEGLFSHVAAHLIYLRILEGGAESGFRHVRPEEYRPRLLHFHGDKRGVQVKEIRRNRSLLDNTDVYILDRGLKLLQWNGSGCNKEEKMKVGDTDTPIPQHHY